MVCILHISPLHAITYGTCHQAYFTGPGLLHHVGVPQVQYEVHKPWYTGGGGTCAGAFQLCLGTLELVFTLLRFDAICDRDAVRLYPYSSRSRVLPFTPMDFYTFYTVHFYRLPFTIYPLLFTFYPLFLPITLYLSLPLPIILTLYSYPLPFTYLYPYPLFLPFTLYSLPLTLYL